jgi:hypothetical protein
MVTREEYEKAKELIHSFKQQKNVYYTKSYTCICCKKNEIKQMRDFHKHTDAENQEEGIWNNGFMSKIVGGYGSIFDGCQFYIAICDSCLDTLLHEKLIVDRTDFNEKMINDKSFDRYIAIQNILEKEIDINNNSIEF